MYSLPALCAGVQSAGASCPVPPATCDVQTALYGNAANPNKLTGAVVWFPSFSDDYQVLQL